MTITIITCEQGTPEWFAARAGACTASRFADARSRVGGLDDKQLAYVNAIRRGLPEADAAAEAGYKKAPTSDTVRRVLAGERVDVPSERAIKYAWLLAHERVAQQPLDDTFTTYAMRRGIELEPEAREAYERRYGVMVDQGGVVLTEDGLFGYSTDGEVVGERGGVEIKCPMAADKLGAVWSNPMEAEAEYIDQIDGGMWLRGWEWIDLIVYCPWLKSVGKELFVKRIWRDEERIEALERDLLEFIRLSQGFEAALRSSDLLARHERLPGRVFVAAQVPPWEPTITTAKIADAAITTERAPLVAPTKIAAAASGAQSVAVAADPPPRVKLPDTLF